VVGSLFLTGKILSKAKEVFKTNEVRMILTHYFYKMATLAGITRSLKQHWLVGGWVDAFKLNETK
jgi:hypothetical protein